MSDSTPARPALESQPGAVAAPRRPFAARLEYQHVYTPGTEILAPWACGVCGSSPGSDRHRCAWDGCEPLTDKQRAFATGACRAAWHDWHHPRINPLGLPKAGGPGSIQDRIRELLSDGLQRTAVHVASELRVGADTAARELRKLAAREPRLLRVVRGGHERAVWFLRREAA